MSWYYRADGPDQEGAYKSTQESNVYMWLFTCWPRGQRGVVQRWRDGNDWHGWMSVRAFLAGSATWTADPESAYRYLEGDDACDENAHSQTGADVAE